MQIIQKIECGIGEKHSTLVEVDCNYNSFHHPQEVLLVEFSLYVHKGGLKHHSFPDDREQFNSENPWKTEVIFRYLSCENNPLLSRTTTRQIFYLAQLKYICI